VRVPCWAVTSLGVVEWALLLFFLVVVVSVVGGFLDGACVQRQGPVCLEQRRTNPGGEVVQGIYEIGYWTVRGNRT